MIIMLVHVFELLVFIDWNNLIHMHNHPRFKGSGED